MQCHSFEDSKDKYAFLSQEYLRNEFYQELAFLFGSYRLNDAIYSKLETLLDLTGII